MKPSKKPTARRASKSAAQLDREITEALKPLQRDRNAALISAQLDIVRGQLAILDTTQDQLLGSRESSEVCDSLTVAIRALSDAVDAALTTHSKL
jgi:hypothetical protein